MGWSATLTPSIEAESVCRTRAVLGIGYEKANSDLWIKGLAFEFLSPSNGRRSSAGLSKRQPSSRATKIAWRKFQAACQVLAMTAVTCFVLEYTFPAAG